MTDYPAVTNRIWMPFSSHDDQTDSPPVVMERGDGIYLYDKDGKRYIDAIGSWWVSSFGHCHPKITTAVKCQLDKLEHVLMAGFVSDATLELTEVLGNILSKRYEKIFYSDNGSTAVEAALKIALQYHALRGSKRNAFVSLGGGYHGDTLGAVSIGAIPQMHELFHKRFKAQYSTDPPHCSRCTINKRPDTCDAECMNSLARILYENKGTIAACVFEPMVQGAAGMRIYPAKVLRKIFELCRVNGVITIADEVATGLGRTGEMFACDHVKIMPDIMCLAKGLSGGYLPIAVTAVSENICAEFKGGGADKVFNHGHTFTGNPLASAAAAAAMKLLVDTGLPKSAGATIKYFAGKVSELDKLDNVSCTRSLGFAGAFDIVKDKRGGIPFPADKNIPKKLARAALEKGLILRPLGSAVYYMPPFNITTDEIDLIFELTKEALSETLRQ